MSEVLEGSNHPARNKVPNVDVGNRRVYSVLHSQRNAGAERFGEFRLQPGLRHHLGCSLLNLAELPLDFSLQCLHRVLQTKKEALQIAGPPVTDSSVLSWTVCTTTLRMRREIAICASATLQAHHAGAILGDCPVSVNVRAGCHAHLLRVRLPDSLWLCLTYLKRWFETRRGSSAPAAKNG